MVCLLWLAERERFCEFSNLPGLSLLLFAEVVFSLFLYSSQVRYKTCCTNCLTSSDFKSSDVTGLYILNEISFQNHERKSCSWFLWDVPCDKFTCFFGFRMRLISCSFKSASPFHHAILHRISGFRYKFSEDRQTRNLLGLKSECLDVWARHVAPRLRLSRPPPPSTREF